MSIFKHISKGHFPIKTLLLVELAVVFILALFFVFKPINLNFIKWHNLNFLWLFILSPLASFLYLYHVVWKRKALENWHGKEFFSETNAANHSFGNLNLNHSFKKFLLFKGGLVFLLLAILGPKSGGEMVESTSEGIELIIALDLSPSMMAEDISPNRLSVAKKAAENTINQLGGDLVGLVVFSGRAFTQVPLTNDYGSTLTYLKALEINTIRVKGTSISQAIDESLTLFSDDSAASKVILLFTDGEDHEGELEQAILDAKELQVKISTVAMGSENGAPIPAENGQSKFKQDNSGSTIISKTNRELLEQISSSTNGDYFEIKTGAPAEVKKLVNYIENEQTAEMGTFTFSNLIPRFQIPLIFSLIFFILFVLFKEKRQP